MKVNEPYIYFEIFHLDKENSKYEIELAFNGKFRLLRIEPPCNDRNIVAVGDEIGELVQWAIENE